VKGDGELRAPGPGLNPGSWPEPRAFGALRESSPRSCRRGVAGFCGTGAVVAREREASGDLPLDAGFCSLGLDLRACLRRSGERDPTVFLCLVQTFPQGTHHPKSALPSLTEFLRFWCAVPELLKEEDVPRKAGVECGRARLKCCSNKYSVGENGRGRAGAAPVQTRGC
jgi:hypothetical protein